MPEVFPVEKLLLIIGASVFTKTEGTSTHTTIIHIDLESVRNILARTTPLL